jgi:hypothetical protein
MKPLVAAVAVLLGTVVQAQARDCAAIGDPAKRLQCYDDASRPAAKAKPAAARPADFAAYPVDVYRGPSRQPDFKGRDRASANYRTRILQGMQGPPNFAGRTRVVDIGCGTGCIFHPVVDLPTGRVAAFPLSADDHPYLEIDYRPDSRLMVAKWQTEKGCGSEAFVWNGAGFDSMGARDRAKLGPPALRRILGGERQGLQGTLGRQLPHPGHRLQGLGIRVRHRPRHEGGRGLGPDDVLRRGGRDLEGDQDVRARGRRQARRVRQGPEDGELPAMRRRRGGHPAHRARHGGAARRNAYGVDLRRAEEAGLVACDSGSPTMTFYGRTPPGDVAAVLAPGSGVAMPATGAPAEKAFAKLFGMQARTVVLDGRAQLASYFDGLRRHPISVSTDTERWSFAIERGKSQKPVSDFRTECIP